MICICQFQSTLPHGSDLHCSKSLIVVWDFNPRSLTGATYATTGDILAVAISIHAPSRERPSTSYRLPSIYTFQSTLPHGSDTLFLPSLQLYNAISIHAPSRERRLTAANNPFSENFNPRSLTGATFCNCYRWR